MQRLTVFYSWQSDRDEKVCRYFIRDALKVAAAHLKVSGVELVIDYDTLNEPGMPEITETILRKISACDVFLPDLTFVAVTEEGKAVTNPNVTLELGYALKVKGPARILPVLNAHWGDEPLPFNIRHRRVSTKYAAGPGLGSEERRQRQKALATQLSGYLAMIARQMRSEASRTEKTLRRELSDYWWAEGVVNRQPPDAHPIVPEPHLLLHLVPEEVLDGEVDLDLATVEASRNSLELEHSVRGQLIGVWWARGALWSAPRGPNPEYEWASCVKDNGLVEWRVNIGRLIEDDPTILVHGERLEAQIIALVDRGLAFLRAQGLLGRVLAGAILYDTDRRIEVPHPGGGSGRLGAVNPQLPPAVILAGALESGDCLKPLLDGFWITAGRALGSPSFSHGSWAGYAERRD